MTVSLSIAAWEMRGVYRGRYNATHRRAVHDHASHGRVSCIWAVIFAVLGKFYNISHWLRLLGCCKSKVLQPWNKDGHPFSQKGIVPGRGGLSCRETGFLLTPDWLGAWGFKGSLFHLFYHINSSQSPDTAMERAPGLVVSLLGLYGRQPARTRNSCLITVLEMINQSSALSVKDI